MLTLLSSHALAVLFAVVAAACFAGAALLQHHAVSQAATSGGTQTRLGVAAFLSLLRSPRWLIGSGVITLGTVLHVIALTLAPISLIQPVGVLAVPFVVLASAALDRRRPARNLLAPVALCVTATGGFVALADHPATAVPLPSTTLLGAAAAVSLLVVVLWLGSHAWASVVRAGMLASVGAVCFGLGSTILRSISVLWVTPARLLEGPSVVAIAIMACAMALGGLAVQHAYAAGAAAVVTSTLTVGDPLVAVLLGIMLLGEAPHLGVASAAGMLVCAVGAAAGVVLISRRHPDARRPAPSSHETTVPDHASASSQLLADPHSPNRHLPTSQERP